MLKDLNEREMFKINKQKILNKYGEYETPLEIAKTLEEYNFRLNWNFQDIKDYINECNEAKKMLPFKVKGIDVMAKLQFGHFDIEMTVRWFKNGKLYIDYYTCSEGSEYGWDSFEGADLSFDISQIETKEKLEEIMYNEFMRMAKHYNQYWSKLNN